MKLDFLDSKYGLQIVYLLFLSVVGSAIFSAISVALSSLIYGVSLIDIQDFDKLLTHPNARNIILLMLVLQTFGMIILPVIVFVKTVINQPKLDLKLNLESIQNTQIFRAGQYSDVIFLSENIKNIIEEINISGTDIRIADGWNDSHRF